MHLLDAQTFWRPDFYVAIFISSEIGPEEGSTGNIGIFIRFYKFAIYYLLPEEMPGALHVCSVLCTQGTPQVTTTTKLHRTTTKCSSGIFMTCHGHRCFSHIPYNKCHVLTRHDTCHSGMLPHCTGTVGAALRTDLCGWTAMCIEYLDIYSSHTTGQAGNQGPSLTLYILYNIFCIQDIIYTGYNNIFNKKI